MNNGCQRNEERIIIVDVIGELFKVYSLATIVYCGGSLVPKGGQNILEAAAWGKVIFYGPQWRTSARKNFAGNVGCGITVKTRKNCLKELLNLLNHPEEIISRGEKGREVVLSNIGASAGYADLISKYI